MRVCQYTLNEDSLDTLIRTTDRLFDWQEPDLPNDLCLMRADEPWLTTMASDGVAVLSLDDRELVEFETALPQLKLVRVKSQA